MGQALIEAVLQLLVGIVQPRHPTRLGLALTEGPRWRRVAVFILIVTVVPAVSLALVFATLALIAVAF
jgi:hypothetical protein